MAKKHWIYIKRGLSENAKHRQQMGECVWLYMHIIDRADWETGIAYDWKDEQEAADMDMPLRTLRDQRRKLDELDYITCKQGKHKQDIIIKRWINPRDYSGKMMNKGGNETSPSEDNGDTNGDTNGSSQNVTPTSDSISKSLPEDFQEIEEQANRHVDKYLDMMHFPGAKSSARIDAILSYLGETLHINSSGKDWEKFARFVFTRQEDYHEDIQVFIKWMKAQRGYDIQFWPPKKMITMWPQAFIIQEEEGETEAYPTL